MKEVLSFLQRWMIYDITDAQEFVKESDESNIIDLNKIFRCKESKLGG